MAGHSQFKNIMHRKGAQDAKRSKVFAKLAREITVATKIGIPDPKQNPRLRNAIINARHENMPNDKINKAIQKASSSEDNNNFDEIRYEAIANNGISLIIETLTDNRNRTASEIRSILNKNGGTLAETGSSVFNFKKIAEIVYNLQNCSKDDFFEYAVENAADDVLEDENIIIATCKQEEFGKLRDALEKKFGEPMFARLKWQAVNELSVEKNSRAKILNIIDLLEENDDVQNVYSNLKVNNDE